MDRTKLLEQRAQARAAKRLRDAGVLTFHERAVAALLDPDQGRAVREQAFASIDLWERGQLCEPWYIDTWRAILALPAASVAAAILRTDDDGVALRQNSPFGFMMRQVVP